MRQQEANQFDKGMSLDTNPIAMDNHTLASALNATMITMNGNELVLQNDMGNAKVESAYLPSGFVPVGLKEFGGIVYVASYNPFSKQSQIGSFPSPERNVSGEDIGKNVCALEPLVETTSTDYITTTVKRVLLIEGPIRPGDKFVVQGSTGAVNYLRTNTQENLITFKVVVVDSEGASIDITSDMVAQDNGVQPNFIFTGEDVKKANFSTFKSKIAGSIYLQESLVIPSYISVNISGSETDSGQIQVSFYPQAYDSEGNEWTLNKPKYKISVTQDETNIAVSDDNTCIVQKIAGSMLEYTITPYYDYGYIGVLEKKGSINVDQIGSGNVEFGSFRYYNDIINGTLSLEYDIKSYLAEGIHYLDSVILEAYDADNWLITGENLSVGDPLKIELSTSNTFGSFSELITFGANNSTLQKGHMYLARIAVVRKSLKDTSEKQYTTKWFALLTNTLANDYYVDHPTESMISLDETVDFQFNWKLKWSQKQVSDIYKDNQTNNTTDPLPVEKTNIKVENADISGICLETERVGSVVEQFVPEITINTGDEFFPFKIKAKLETTLKEKTWNTSDISTVGELKADSLLSVETNDVLESEGSSNSVWLKSNTTSEDNTTTIELGYKLLSQYFAKLASNGLGSGDTNKLTFESNSCTALIPYLSTNSDYEDTLEKMVGAIPFINEDSSDIQPSAWFSLSTYKSKKKKSRSVRIGIMNSASTYTDLTDISGDIPENGESDDNDNYGVFSTSSENQSWKYYSQYTMDYVKNTLKVNPTIFLWQGCGDADAGLWTGGKKSTANFTIPMLFDATGEMYVLNQYKSKVSNKNLLYDIVNTFSHIYVSQQGQSIAFDYYKSSSSISDYVYTNPYSAVVNLSFETKATLDESDIVGNGQKVKYGDETLYLPKFSLIETVDIYTPEIVVNSYDQLDEDITYLEAEPQIESIAVVKDSSGNDCLVDKAYTLEGTQEKLNQAHVYYLYEGEGKEARLIDCNKYEISKSAMAKAFFEKKLKIMYDNALEMNVVILNKSRLSDVIINKNTLKVGSDKERMCIHEIARKHLLDLRLFEGEGIKTIQT